MIIGSDRTLMQRVYSRNMTPPDYRFGFSMTDAVAYACTVSFTGSFTEHDFISGELSMSEYVGGLSNHSHCSRRDA
jgi:hypothetical protein